MLTKELIQQNVPDLTDEQITKLEELGNNTLQVEVDKVIKKTRSQVDEVLQKHGFPKAGEKTSEHLDNVLITLKESQMSEDVKQKVEIVTKLEKERDQLKEQLKNAPDSSKKEKDLLDKIKLLEDSLNEQKGTYETEKEQHKKDLIKLQLTSKMPKVKEGIGDKTRELHVNTAINNLVGLADFDDKGNLVFRDKDGTILYNPENKNNPYTPEEMFSKDDYFKEIMDNGTNKKGLGLKNIDNKNKFIPSISGAATQIEADAIIEQTLLSQGISKTDTIYQEKYDLIRKENNVSELPRQ